jgi:DNA-binding NarL/FixJ family response regulator
LQDLGRAICPIERRIMRVLLVDDDPGVRALLRLRLGRLPRVEAVTEAANGADGVLAATAQQPDVIVLDLEMPVMGGDEAIPLLRAACPRSVIVINTSTPRTGIPDIVIDLSDACLSKATDDVLAYVARLPPDA